MTTSLELEILVGVSVQQQRRHLDARQHLPQVGLGEALHHWPHPGRADLQHHRQRLLDQLRRRRVGEQPRQVAADPLGGRQLGFAHDPPQALLDDLGRQRARPARIR
jgi:hypothetical protein